MALSCKTGSFTGANATGNQSVTGVGFAPKAILFFATPLTADGSAPDFWWMVGAATSSTNQRVVGFWSDDGQTTSSTFGGHIATSCIDLRDGTSVRRADLSSFDADGFTVNWSNVDFADAVISYMAIGGDDLTNATIVDFTSPTATGNQAYTGVGFQPDAAIFWGAGNESGTGTFADDALSLGFAVSSTERYSSVFRIEDARSTALSARYQRTDKCISYLDNTIGLAEDADFVSFDSDGWTLNWDTVQAASREWWALLLQGGQYSVGNDTQATSTGTKATTGVGFTPKGLLLSSMNQAASTTVNDHARSSIGTVSATTERISRWAGDKNGVATTESDHDLDTVAAIKMMTEGTPTIDAEADLSSFDSDGFTLDWTAADGTAREFGFLAFGDAGGGGGGANVIPPPLFQMQMTG